MSTAKSLVLLLFALAIARSGVSAQRAADAPSTITVESESRQTEGALTQYRGGVTVRSGGITIKADEVDLNRGTGELEARGRVSVTLTAEAEFLREYFRRKLLSLRSDLAAATATMTAQHPTVVGLQSEIAEVESMLVRVLSGSSFEAESLKLRVPAER